MLEYTIRSGKIEAGGSWLLGQKFSQNPHIVEEIEADGEESHLIITHIMFLKRTSLSVQHWFGDDAKMIAAFLVRYSKGLD